MTCDEIRKLLHETFTANEAVDEWMATPQEYLYGMTPTEALASESGAARVENLVRAMVHGVPI